MNAEEWLANNNQYLAAAIQWLKLRLNQVAEFTTGTPPTVKPEAIATAAAAMVRATASDPPPALILLSQQFGLSQFEQAILLLCAAMELDTQLATLCAQAQDNPNRPYPTFALALTCFDSPAWDTLSPERPLRHWRLIEIHQAGAQPLTTSPLRADERIVSYLKGLNYLDDRLATLVVPLDPWKPPGFDAIPSLPPSQQSVVEAIAHQIQQSAQTSTFPVLQLLGSDTASKQLIAWEACQKIGLRPYRLSPDLLPAQIAGLDTLIKLWQRESYLLPLALYLDGRSLDDMSPSSTAILHRFLERSHGIFFVDVRETGLGCDRPTITFDIAKPTTLEQREAWAIALNGHGENHADQLVSQFHLSLPEIWKIAQSTQAAAKQPHVSFEDQLWQSCLTTTRPKLDTLAQRLDPKATWNDLVLPDEELDLLHQVTDQVRQRSIVYDDWGFRQRMNRGLGVSALFAGESGTGKTMAAEVIANDLKLNLYRIDLSSVVSKYIGETEKNLRRLFDAAEDGGAILFFDEADALFGKRSEVKDSHDRYANIEINYLLQRIESYQGLAILTTNMKNSLDTAFMRRLRFIITFPFPGIKERRTMWQKAFPAKTPTQGLDCDRLAKLNLAGGNIHSIALNAAFLAAQAGTPITLPLLLKAARTEFYKLDRPINEADFRP